MTKGFTQMKTPTLHNKVFRTFQRSIQSTNQSVMISKFESFLKRIGKTPVQAQELKTAKTETQNFCPKFTRF